MKKKLKICLLFLLITNLAYSQKCSDSYSNVKFRISKSVKYNNKLQKSLLFTGFSNKRIKIIGRKPKRIKKYSFRVNNSSIKYTQR
jgi:hypothetical protein